MTRQTGPFTLGPNTIEFDVGALRHAIPLLKRLSADAKDNDLDAILELKDIAETVVRDHDRRTVGPVDGSNRPE